MKDEIFSKMTDKEKVMLFDLAFDTSKEKKIKFEDAMDSVIQAFLISKNNDMDMTPSPEFAESKPFEMNMAPKDTDFKSSDNYGGPTYEPIDTQKVEYENNVTI